jgi:HSP20 family protein
MERSSTVPPPMVPHRRGLEIALPDLTWISNRHSLSGDIMNVLLHSEPLAGFDTLLDEFLRPALARPAASPAPRRIRVDVKETPEAYVVLADLPGVKKDRIAIDVETNQVAIAVETARAEPAGGEKWLHVEREAGKSERRFTLPNELDAARAEARFADGVLELTLPKKAPATARKVEVH